VLPRAWVHACVRVHASACVPHPPTGKQRVARIPAATAAMRAMRSMRRGGVLPKLLCVAATSSTAVPLARVLLAC
jgi:hypothetical protein